MPAGPTDQGRQTGRQLNASPAQPCKTDHPFVACRSKHKAYLACVHRAACDPFQRHIHDKVAAGSANKSGCLCLTRWPACDWNLLSSSRVLLGRASATATATSVQLVAVVARLARQHRPVSMYCTEYLPSHHCPGCESFYRLGRPVKELSCRASRGLGALASPRAGRVTVVLLCDMIRADIVHNVRHTKGRVKAKAKAARHENAEIRGWSAWPGRHRGQPRTCSRTAIEGHTPVRPSRI